MKSFSRLSIMSLPIYPFLMGLLPVFYFFAQNSFELEWFDIVRPMMITFLLTWVIYKISLQISSCRDAAMLATMVALLHFISYPLVFELVRSNIYTVRHRYFMPTWSLVFLSSYLLILYRVRKAESLKKVNYYMNLFMFMLFAMQLVRLVESTTHYADSSVIQQNNRLAAEKLAGEALARQRTGDRLPDIYYLVLDAYAREDILRTRFQYNNQTFLDSLRKMDFTVLDQSFANYPFTHLSLSSTLNLQYLDQIVIPEFVARAPATNPNRYQYLSSKFGKEYISRNQLRYFLEKLGYTWYRNDSGYPMTRLRIESPSDLAFGSVSQLELMILDNNMFGHLLGLLTNRYSVQAFSHQNWRKALNQFASLPTKNSPKFCFYHIVSPHGPFSFDDDGSVAPERVDGLVLPGVMDHKLVTKERDPKYRELYPKNVAGLNIYVRQAIEKILKQTNGEAIIIIQSDHGPSLGFNYYDIGKSDVQARFANLSAIYLPKKYSRKGFDSNMSNVNTFRLLLANVFGIDIPKLQDKAWFAFAGDLQFKEVTDAVQPNLEPPSEIRKSE